MHLFMNASTGIQAESKWNYIYTIIPQLLTPDNRIYALCSVKDEYEVSQELCLLYDVKYTHNGKGKYALNGR